MSTYFAAAIKCGLNSLAVTPSALTIQSSSPSPNSEFTLSCSTIGRATGKGEALIATVPVVERPLLPGEANREAHRQELSQRKQQLVEQELKDHEVFVQSQQTQEEIQRRARAALATQQKSLDEKQERQLNEIEQLKKTIQVTKRGLKGRLGESFLWKDSDTESSGPDQSELAAAACKGHSEVDRTAVVADSVAQTVFSPSKGASKLATRRKVERHVAELINQQTELRGGHFNIDNASIQ